MEAGKGGRERERERERERGRGSGTVICADLGRAPSTRLREAAERAPPATSRPCQSWQGCAEGRVRDTWGPFFQLVSHPLCSLGLSWGLSVWLAWRASRESGKEIPLGTPASPPAARHSRGCSWH